MLKVFIVTSVTVFAAEMIEDYNKQLEVYKSQLTDELRMLELK